MADGVYSMFADLAPFAELRELLDRHPNLWLYVDDSHGVGWAGKHGRGPALDVLGGHARVIAACSLNKSFACAGGAIVFPDPALRQRVKTAGGPMMFSGPVQPPLLGAAIESARIHLCDELPEMQAALRERVELFTSLCEEFGIPLATRDLTPIRYVPLGLPVVAHDVIKEILADGYYTNLGTFPAVPMKHAGVRMTITLHHTFEDIRGLVASLARHVPAALERGGEAAKRRHAKIVGEHGPALVLEHHRSASALDAREWDSLLGERGTFTVDGLPYLERAFGERGRAPRGPVELPLLRGAQPGRQGRAGDVLHGGAVEGRHARVGRGLLAGRGAPGRGPVLPDVDDVRDGLAADRGRPPVPGPQRGLEGRAGPVDGRGV